MSVALDKIEEALRENRAIEKAWFEQEYGEGTPIVAAQVPSAANGPSS
jgi:hypothetical protein